MGNRVDPDQTLHCAASGWGLLTVFSTGALVAMNRFLLETVWTRQARHCAVFDQSLHSSGVFSHH